MSCVTLGASVEMPHVALPVPSSVCEPLVQAIGLPLSKKPTVPVGGPVTTVLELTVAVKVTSWLLNDGFFDEVSVVSVVDLLTVSWNCLVVTWLMLSVFFTVTV